MSQETSKAIGESIETWVNSLADHTEGQGAGILGDWVAVACMVYVGDDGVPRAEYYLAMKDGAMLPHIADGMLRRGVQIAQGSEEQS